MFIASCLRIRLNDPVKPKATKTNAQRCKEYREFVKSDPEKYALYRLKYMERCRRYNHRKLSDEEKARRQERDRLRQQKYREKKAAQLPPKERKQEQQQSSPASTCQSQRQAETARATLRKQWAAQKRKERFQWSLQKKRCHREKTLANYGLSKDAKAKQDSDDVHPRAPVSPTVNLEPLCTVPTLGSDVQQQHPSTVAPSDVAFQGPSVCTYSIPDPPVDGVHIIVNHSEEREGVATEGVQTLSGLVSPSTSPARPVHGSSLKKRRAENKKTGMTKRPRQIDHGENSVILEYYQILIQKEKQAMEMAVEKDRLAMERDRQLIEMGRQAARCFAVNAEISELQKQKLEAELKDNKTL